MTGQTLIYLFPGFILGWSAAFALMLCRDAGDFDRLVMWWREVRAAFEYRGNWD